MSFSNVSIRIYAGIKNLDKDRFKLINLGQQSGMVIVCVDNKLHSYTFNTVIKDINVAIWKCNIAFDENRWEDNKFVVFLTHDKKFLEKGIYQLYKDINARLEALNRGVSYYHRNTYDEVTGEDYLKV